jgi:hypothetical protein
MKTHFITVFPKTWVFFAKPGFINYNICLLYTNIIEDGGYLPEQVFSNDETGLFWKRIPARTYIAKTEKSVQGFKVAKDRDTSHFCCNASGDLFTKPMFIHRSQNPRQ